MGDVGQQQLKDLTRSGRLGKTIIHMSRASLARRHVLPLHLNSQPMSQQLSSSDSHGAVREIKPHWKIRLASVALLHALAIETCSLLGRWVKGVGCRISPRHVASVDPWVSIPANFHGKYINKPSRLCASSVTDSIFIVALFTYYEH
jgi:hypothetical protein